MVPFATFLFGALFTLLMPVGLLIALSVWYWKFSARVPETEEASERGTAHAAGNPAPDVADPVPSVASEPTRPAHDLY